MTIISVFCSYLIDKQYYSEVYTGRFWGGAYMLGLLSTAIYLPVANSILIFHICMQLSKKLGLDIQMEVHES